VTASAGVVGVGAAVVGVYLGIRTIVRTLQPGAPPFPAVEAPSSYRLDYRVVTQPGNLTNDEEHIVERPWNAVWITRRNGKMLTGEITNDQGLYLFNDPKGWELLSGGRQRAVDDPQPADALRDAISRHLARVLRTDDVLGRPCTVVRTGNPISQAVTRPTRRTHTDLCIDHNGLVLRSDETYQGKHIDLMTATNVDVNPPLAPGTFDPSPPPSSGSPLAITAIPLSPESQAKLTPRLRTPPDVRYVGGWVRVQPGVTGGLEATTTLLYLKGDFDLVEVDYVSGPSTKEGVHIAVANGRTGYLQLGLDESSLSVEDGPDASVNLRGTDLALLVELGRSLDLSSVPAG
jgi:hypothetical protein